MQSCPRAGLHWTLKGFDMRKISYKEVYYERNERLGIDPYCHECTSHKPSSTGYCYITINRKKISLPRYMFLMCGVTPEVVLHKCDNRKCINFNHLISGNQSDNMVDMAVKKRHGNIKLSLEEIKAIKSSLRTGCNQSILASFYGVSSKTISNINTGRRWRFI